MITTSKKTAALATAFGAAFALTTLPQDANATETNMTNPAHIVQYVKFESALPRETVLAAAEERRPLFEAMPGLVQKYYVEHDEPNTYGGIYIWKDKASMAAFLQSDLFQTIPAAYGIKTKPEVEVIPVLFPLR